MSSKIKLGLILIVISVFTISFFQPLAPTFLSINKNTKIALVGGNLGSRMINYDHFETELHLRYPENNLMVRNMCDGEILLGFAHTQLDLHLGLFQAQKNSNQNLPIPRKAKAISKRMTNG